MNNIRLRAAALVALQFSCIFFLLFTTRKPGNLLAGVLFCSLSVLLVAWAIYSMRSSKLRISPVPDANASLVEKGPYGFIRHPMYLAILLGVAGLFFFDFTLTRLTAAIILLIVLLVKLQWEEKMLENKFGAYRNYRKRTSRLIPGLY